MTSIRSCNMSAGSKSRPESFSAAYKSTPRSRFTELQGISASPAKSKRRIYSLPVSMKEVPCHGSGLFHEWTAGQVP
jgi:hypothetical protein